MKTCYQFWTKINAVNPWFLYKLSTRKLSSLRVVCGLKNQKVALYKWMKTIGMPQKCTSTNILPVIVGGILLRFVRKVSNAVTSAIRNREYCSTCIWLSTLYSTYQWRNNLVLGSTLQLVMLPVPSRLVDQEFRYKTELALTEQLTNARQRTCHEQFHVPPLGQPYLIAQQV